MQCDRTINSLPPGPFFTYVIKWENDSANVDCFFAGACGPQQSCASHSEQRFSHSAEKITHFHFFKKKKEVLNHKLKLTDKINLSPSPTLCAYFELLMFLKNSTGLVCFIQKISKTYY